MKLVPKLTMMFILSTSAVLCVNGFLRVRREVGLFETDRVRDQELMARAVAHAALAIWNENGPERAATMVDEIGERSSRLRIAWRTIRPTASALDARLAKLAPGQTMAVPSQNTETGRERCIYATLATIEKPTGAVALCESLAAQEAYVRKTVIETAITTISLAAVCALLSGVLGVWLVGKPVAALSAKARRIGAGDFSSPLHLPRRDELAHLGREMNAMCDQLAAAGARIAEETEQRVKAVAQLRHADRLTTVGKLASGLAHELGTPLNVIEARAEMIAAGETTPAESIEYAAVIREATERMTRLIRRLLDFARPRTAQRTPVSIEDLVAKVVDMLEPLAQRKQIRLLAVARAPNVTSLIDADQILQVLTNLVVNAIQAMERPGEIELVSAIEWGCPPADHGGQPGDFICLGVADQGPGIDATDLPHLFEPFFTTKDVGSGTGLGLAVAYGIVRDHGGWIDVRTTRGAGSEFKVYLPLRVD